MDSKAEYEPRPWTDVFRKSRTCPAVFNLTPEGEDEVGVLLGGLGLPTVSAGIMFSHYHRTSPLLDGWVSSFSPYGFPSGLLTAGTRVIGYRPFRLLCHLLDIRAPRRLKGEPPVPSSDALLAELVAQRQKADEDLARHANRGMVSDTDSLRALVFETWGSSIAPMADRDKHRAHGDGEWGESGFNLYQQEVMERLQVPLSEALEWKRLHADGDEFTALHPHGLDEIRLWIEAGVPPWFVVRYLERGYSFNQVKTYLEAGVGPEFVASFIEPGCTPTQAAGYFEAGLSLREAIDLAEAGVAIEDARRFLGAGVSTHQIMVLFGRGWTLDRLDSSTEEERERVCCTIR